jgi:hypothetical protein
MRTRDPGTSSSSRSRQLVYPDRSRRLLRGGIIAAAVLVVGSAFLYVAGQRTVWSPGDVSAHHARIDLKCAQCHTTGAIGANVESLRCERCHDPAGSDRMLHAAHVFMGSADRRLADAAEELTCATCHRDHRGRAFAMTAVDDRECGSCHEFRGLPAHPEFAAVRAQATAGVGIDFDHDRHIVEAQKASGEACASCHRQTPDRRGFQPLAFDRDCAACHLKNGVFESETDFVSPDLMMQPPAIPAGVLSGSVPAIRANPRGKLQAAGLRHRDPFILYNAARLRRSIDREGDDAERMALRARIQYLQQLEQTPPPRLVPPAERDAAIAALQDELASIDVALNDGGSTNDDQALRQLTLAAQSVAASLQAVASGAAIALPAAGPPPAAAAADPDAAARWERRTAELIGVLDAVAARAPGSELAARAASLRTRIEQLRPSGTTGDDPAANTALVDRLQQLDDVLQAVRNVPDAGVRAELGGIDGLRQLALERAGGGLSREEFEGRRRELLALLDSIEQRTGDAHRARVSVLRRRAMALMPGAIGDADTRRRRRQRQRQLDRLLIERELAASPKDADDQPAQDATLDRSELARAIAEASARLGELDRAPRMSAPTSEEERLDRANALEALLAPCLKCHQLDATRARMAAVRIAEPVMQRSNFNHAPHVTSAACELCHSMARRSKFATDVNVPGVGACQTCHRPSQVRATCATCHVYHPRSAASLAVAAR